MDFTEVLEIVDITTGEPGATVHSNTHCNALVENPFAWDEDGESDD